MQSNNGLILQPPWGYNARTFLGLAMALGLPFACKPIGLASVEISFCLDVSFFVCVCLRAWDIGDQFMSALHPAMRFGQWASRILPIPSLTWESFRPSKRVRSQLLHHFFALQMVTLCFGFIRSGGAPVLAPRNSQCFQRRANPCCCACMQRCSQCTLKFFWNACTKFGSFNSFLTSPNWISQC